MLKSQHVQVTQNMLIELNNYNMFKLSHWLTTKNWKRYISSRACRINLLWRKHSNSYWFFRNRSSSNQNPRNPRATYRESISWVQRSSCILRLKWDNETLRRWWGGWWETVDHIRMAYWYSFSKRFNSVLVPPSVIKANVNDNHATDQKYVAEGGRSSLFIIFANRLGWIFNPFSFKLLFLWKNYPCVNEKLLTLSAPRFLHFLGTDKHPKNWKSRNWWQTVNIIMLWESWLELNQVDNVSKCVRFPLSYWWIICEVFPSNYSFKIEPSMLLFDEWAS